MGRGMFSYEDESTFSGFEYFYNKFLSSRKILKLHFVQFKYISKWYALPYFLSFVCMIASLFAMRYFEINKFEVYSNFFAVATLFLICINQVILWKVNKHMGVQYQGSYPAEPYSEQYKYFLWRDCLDDSMKKYSIKNVLDYINIELEGYRAIREIMQPWILFFAGSVVMAGVWTVASALNESFNVKLVGVLVFAKLLWNIMYLCSIFFETPESKLVKLRWYLKRLEMSDLNLAQIESEGLDGLQVVA